LDVHNFVQVATIDKFDCMLVLCESEAIAFSLKLNLGLFSIYACTDSLNILSVNKT